MRSTFQVQLTLIESSQVTARLYRTLPNQRRRFFDLKVDFLCDLYLRVGKSGPPGLCWCFIGTKSELMNLPYTGNYTIYMRYIYRSTLSSVRPSGEVWMTPAFHPCGMSEVHGPASNTTVDIPHVVKMR